MGTYVIGDVHGCYSQFIELIERVEGKDPEAKFILVGDIVSRGPEDAQMLAWAYENVTLDGKYQMVLGNHDDIFIEAFGRGEFETLYSLSRIVGFNYEAKKEEFSHLEDQSDLMYEYAKFLSTQPLYKKLEVNGKNYTIAHAWYPEKLLNFESDADKIAYFRRFHSLWHRDREEYADGFKDEYEPMADELLIHGHTPTLADKNRMSRDYSPGKIWRRENSVNIDCGLVFNVMKYSYGFSKFGNLAAYHIEKDEALYLWDIVDEYALNDDEYFEDRLARQKAEREESERKYNALWEEMKEPYLNSFYKQAFDLDETPDNTDRDYRVSFNFMGNYMSNLSIFKGEKKDSGNLPIVALHEVWGKRDANVLYTYDERNKLWINVGLKDDFKYQVFRYNDKDYLFGVNDYNRQYAEGMLYHMSVYGAREILRYSTDTPYFDWEKKDKILEVEEKYGLDRFEEKEKLTGIMTWDFYHGSELFQIKIARNHGDAYHARITNRSGEVIAKISQVY